MQTNGLRNPSTFGPVPPASPPRKKNHILSTRGARAFALPTPGPRKKQGVYQDWWWDARVNGREKMLRISLFRGRGGRPRRPVRSGGARDRLLRAVAPAGRLAAPPLSRRRRARGGHLDGRRRDREGSAIPPRRGRAPARRRHVSPVPGHVHQRSRQDLVLRGEGEARRDRRAEPARAPGPRRRRGAAARLRPHRERGGHAPHAHRGRRGVVRAHPGRGAAPHAGVRRGGEVYASPSASRSLGSGSSPCVVGTERTRLLPPPPPSTPRRRTDRRLTSGRSSPSPTPRRTSPGWTPSTVLAIRTTLCTGCPRGRRNSTCG